MVRKSTVVLLCIAFSICFATPLLSPRVVNGTNAYLGEIPYIVSIRYYLNHICGGSILNKFYILTAAHCVYGAPSANNFTVQYGVLKISADSVNSIQVDYFTYHEDYAPDDGWRNDVAVLKLRYPIFFSKYVQGVNLPSVDTIAPGWADAVLAGWGYPYTGGSVMETLQKVDIYIYPDVDCEIIHDGKTSSEYHICAGIPKGGKGQCSGDSGGPLSWNGFQYGIVSWSVKPCALTGYPGVFTRVANYIGWIVSHSQY